MYCAMSFVNTVCHNTQVYMLYNTHYHTTIINGVSWHLVAHVICNTVI